MDDSHDFLRTFNNWITVLMLSIFLLGLYVTIASSLDYAKITRECNAAGGKLERLSGEGYVCQKEYTSCGPDENKSGFTVCEQKFKRID